MSGLKSAVLATMLGLAAQPLVAQASLEGLKGLEGLRGLEHLKELQDLQGLKGLKSLKSLEGLRGLEGLKGLESLKGLEGLNGFDALESLGELKALEGPGDPWWDGEPLRGPDQQGQADSLYRAAREALNAGNYQQAAAGFQRVAERYPRSTVAGDATYWAAFALEKTGGERNLRTALQLLNRQVEAYPNARTRRDGEVLATRIRGALARMGNAEAAESVFVRAGPPAGAVAIPNAVPPRGGQEPACRSEDNELRLAALNALLQMDSERAIPILKQVLERRDTCSVELRRKAVFLVSQKRGPEVEDVLLNAARSDSDREVRAQAIFWLSQVRTEKALTALDSILFQSTDPELQNKAIFALSEHRDARATEVLRRFVERTNASDDLKGKAIFWMGQRRGPETFRYLQELYPRLGSQELKDKIIFAMSESREAEARRWLLDLAINPSESIEMRKKALFWAGQNSRASVADLVRLYDTMNDREMREQLIFVYSQRREAEAVDQLMAIAENDPDKELRGKAIFWLGQSKDPRAAEFLLRLINR